MHFPVTDSPALSVIERSTVDSFQIVLDQMSLYCLMEDWTGPVFSSVPNSHSLSWLTHLLPFQVLTVTRHSTIATND